MEKLAGQILVVRSSFDILCLIFLCSYQALEQHFQLGPPRRSAQKYCMEFDVFELGLFFVKKFGSNFEVLPKAFRRLLPILTNILL